MSARRVHKRTRGVSRGCYTPWGPADAEATRIIDKGFLSVRTAQGGGFMLSEGFANSRLTHAARKRATRYARYYCYDVEVTWAIPAYELDEYWPKLFKDRGPAFIPGRDLLVHLSCWCADYLRERRIAPDNKGHQIYLARNSERILRESKCPDLIVLARQHAIGTVTVTTADGREHQILESRFDEAVRRVTVLRLSDCHKRPGHLPAGREHIAQK